MQATKVENGCQSCLEIELLCFCANENHQKIYICNLCMKISTLGLSQMYILINLAMDDCYQKIIIIIIKLALIIL